MVNPDESLIPSAYGTFRIFSKRNVDLILLYQDKRMEKRK